jgi:hypothetical protein
MVTDAAAASANANARATAAANANANGAAAPTRHDASGAPRAPAPRAPAACWEGKGAKEPEQWPEQPQGSWPRQQEGSWGESRSVARQPRAG